MGPILRSCQRVANTRLHEHLRFMNRWLWELACRAWRGGGGYELISRDLLSRVVQKSGTWLLNLTAKFSLSLGCTANDLGSLEMKLRDLFHAFRHPERESRCHEIDDSDREAMAQRVEALLATRLTLADLSASQDVPQAGRSPLSPDVKQPN